ncbi:glycosyltransferase family 8 protein [Cyanobium sp. CH-040]|uniref:glycosyltransferase family 8 protein n=1 Tax=Cyanobium sp. CH-040 TaxID=2823708 RepID=UPI0020CC3589|nr:glycosyltransferase family 8 protein [Cyanobium sp. CH-040]MCP9927194.1 glycosyltransferase family 8 protein [Cyanobium sp. CH-040]
MKTACVFSIDDAYLMPFQVFFHSLEATKSIPSATQLYILHDKSLSGQSINGLQTFFAGYGRKASFLDASPLIPEDLPIREGDHVSPATFYRLFIAEILPSDIGLAVYLDADMLALRSVATLFNEPLTELVAAADHCSPANEIRLWGERGGSYFQAGVLAIPVQRWRHQRMAERFLEVMATQRERIQWWDQDVLNIALCNHWQRLPVWFNVCEATHRALPIAQVKRHAALVHYSGSSKPWNAPRASWFTAHWDCGYEAVFHRPFNRRALWWPWLRSAARSRLIGQRKSCG